MKTKLVLILALLTFITLHSALSTAEAQGTAFTYQGQLQNNGSPASGNYDFTFGLFNTNSTNSGQVGSTLTNLDVAVTNGLFIVTLDFGNVFMGTSYWLAIGVRSSCNTNFDDCTNFTALNPLQELTPTPSAVYASSANSVSATNISGVIPLAQLPASVVTNSATHVTLIGTFSGDGSGLTNLNPANISAGTAAINISGHAATATSATSATTATNVVSGIDITNAFITDASITNAFITNAVITNSSFAGNGAWLTNLNPTNLSAGTAVINISGNAATATSATSATTATNVVSGIDITNAFITDASITNAFITNAVITNSSFAGNGAWLTNLNPTNLSAGTAVINISGNAATATSATSATTATNVVSGIDITNATITDATITNVFITNAVITNSSFAGNGAWLTNLNPTNISAGTASINISGNAATATSATSATTATNVVSGINITNAFITNAFITNSVFVGNGGGLTDLNASQLASGTVPATQLPTATTTTLGAVKIDGSTITISGSGAISAANIGTITSVAMTGDGTVFNSSVSGSPVTSSGTLAPSLAKQSANTVFAGPASGGAAAPSFQTAPTFSGANLTSLNASQLASGTVPAAQLPTATTSTQGAVIVDGSTITIAGGVITAAAASVRTDSTNTWTGTNTFTNTVIATNDQASNQFAGAFTGNGAALTNLNASQLASGTVPAAQLPTATTTTLGAVKIDGSTIAISGSGAISAANIGTITSVAMTGDGTVFNSTVSGSPVTSSGTLAPSLASQSANTIFAGPASGGAAAPSFQTAPTFSGANLTGLNASQLASGTVPAAQLPTATTSTQGAVIVDGSTITIAGGVITAAAASVRTDYTNTWTGTNTFTNTVIATNDQASNQFAGAFTGNGAALTNLNASQLASGAVPSAALTSVPAGNLTGTVPLAQLSGITSAQLSATTWQLATNLNGGNAALASNVVSGIFLTNPLFFNTVFVGNGMMLNNLNASQLTSGTVPAAQLPAVVITNEAPSLTIGSANQIAPLTVPPTVPSAAVGFVATSPNPLSVAVAGRYAYVSFGGGGSGLQIFDVSTPSAPVNIGSTSVGGASVAVAGRYAYAVGGTGAAGLQIIDVSNPSNPGGVGSAVTGSAPVSVAVAGRYAYVVNQSASTLQVFDVSNPSAPINVGSAPTGAAPASVAVAGRYAYVISAAGLQIIDVSAPSAPVSVGSWAGGGASVAVAGRYAYVVGGGMLQVFDVSNPSNPANVGSAATGSTPVSVAVAGRYAYVVNKSGNTLQIIDVSTPSSPVSFGSVATGSTPVSVAVAGRYAYVISGGELQVFDQGGAYIQHLEAGAMETGTLQTRDTVTVGNNLNVRGGLTTGGSALVSGALSVSGEGVASTNYALEVNGAVQGVGSYSSASDARYKTNIARLTHALDKIMAMRGVEYDWRSNAFPQMNFDNGKQLGFVAQEIKEVLPEVVSQDARGYYSIAYSKVIPVLVEAIKDQQQEMNEKNADIEALKQSVADLKKTVQSLAEKK